MTLNLRPGTPLIIDDVQYRVSHWTTDDQVVVQNADTGACANYTSRAITKMFSERRLRLHEKKAEPGVFDPQFAEFGLLSDTLKQIAYDRLVHITAIKEQAKCFSRPVVNRIVAETQQAICDRERRKAEALEQEFDEEKWSHPPSYSSILRWDKAWSEAYDIRALVPNFFRRGGHDPKLNLLVHRYIGIAVDQKWFTKPRRTRKTVLERAIELINEYNKTRPEHEHLAFPSQKTVDRTIAREDGKKVMAARHSRAEANAEFRNYQHLPVADYPHQLVMLDDTPLNLIVVDSVYRTPLGKPHLTCVIDVYSRMVLGFYVSFRPPSADTAMLALRHAILDKSYIEEKYGITQDWPAAGRIQGLLTDNHSSFKKRAFRDAMAGLKIVQHFSPKGQSWVRPHIERWFGTNATSLVNQLPGTTYSNIKQKGKDQPSKDAVMTLPEFIHCLHVWVVEYYNRELHTGLVSTPYDAYQNGVKRVPVKLYSAIEDLDCLLRSGERVKLDKQGIEFEGLLYNSEELTMLRRRGDAPKEVDIRYNPLDIRQIWVLDPKTLSFMTVPACDLDYTSVVLNLDHHKAIQTYGLLTAAQLRDPVKIAEARAKIEGIAEDSTRKTRSAQAGKRVGRLREAMEASQAAAMSSPAAPYVPPKISASANENNDAAVGEPADAAAVRIDLVEEPQELPSEVGQEPPTQIGPSKTTFVPNLSRVQVSRKENHNV